MKKPVAFVPVVLAYCTDCGSRETVALFPKVKTWWHECNQGNVETKLPKGKQYASLSSLSYN